MPGRPAAPCRKAKQTTRLVRPACPPSRLSRSLPPAACSRSPHPTGRQPCEVGNPPAAMHSGPAHPTGAPGGDEDGVVVVRGVGLSTPGTRRTPRTVEGLGRLGCLPAWLPSASTHHVHKTAEVLDAGAQRRIRGAVGAAGRNEGTGEGVEKSSSGARCASTVDKGGGLRRQPSPATPRHRHSRLGQGVGAGPSTVPPHRSKHIKIQRRRHHARGGGGGSTRGNSTLRCSRIGEDAPQTDRQCVAARRRR